ncbi:MAG: peroxiredoxin-like family protein [Pseudomonadota bacterium]
MNTALVLSLFAVAAALFVVIYGNRSGKQIDAALRPGKRLPPFHCQTEDGQQVTSDSLHGSRSVLLFVRGSWCPFCTEQVKSVTDHYRKITEAGGRLIIVTRKPLAITERVAEQFGVTFEFWLDPGLGAASALNLVDDETIPERFHDDFGRRTILPTVLVTDSNNIIRYSYRSTKPSDRPEPAKFMSVFDQIS